MTDEPKGLSRSLPLIEKLHPSLQSMAKELLARASAEGIDLVVVQGLRDYDYQARLYAQGRTAPGLIVTKARPGSSWHNFGRALDVAVLKDGKGTYPNDIALWQKIGSIGKAVGFTWGGDFKSIKDRPHFEYHPGITLAMARADRQKAIA